MIETHVFGKFVPKNAKYLILGSFPVKGTTTDPEEYNWFYVNKRNQFWPILEQVYERELKDKKDKLELFSELGIAITDIILSCERKGGSNLDNNLTNIVINSEMIENIIYNEKVEKIYFTSAFVETLFYRYFKHIISSYPQIELVRLPSPSPRYALMSIYEKTEVYKKLLPRKLSQ